MAWLWALLLLGTVAWSAVAFADYGSLLVRLSGQSQVDRGRLGSNIWQNFLARAGRPGQRHAHERLQQALADARRSSRSLGIASERDAPSEVADVWAWTLRTAAQLGPDARVYLNVPSGLLYFYASFMWYPRPVMVGAPAALIKDDATLARGFRRVTDADLPRLRADGVTHVVARTPSGHQLIDIRPPR
jgi:hypothetical protein